MAHNGGASKARGKRRARDNWRNVTVEDIETGDKGAFSARSAHRAASSIADTHLTFTHEQRTQLLSENKQDEMEDFMFTANCETDQLDASARLASYRLDIGSLESLGSKWSVVWSRDSGKKREGAKRVLYQCKCGYNHAEAGSKERHTFVPFTGCLVHAEVTYQSKTYKVLRIRGNFRHNSLCDEAQCNRVPPLPLSPEVYRVALQQLKEGASLTNIQARNRKMLTSYAYEGQPKNADEWRTTTYRWLLRNHDSRSLYRQYSRMEGLDITEAAHINIDNWLNPESGSLHPQIEEAVFHYARWEDKNGRFELCISTPEMREAAWKYAHKQQMVFDGTFGVCDRKILLFIAMAIDDKGKGVPLAFFLFSAPSGNKNTAAGYNTDILKRLLRSWKVKLGMRQHEEFMPLVCITDTDMIERAALLDVFLSIWLLICCFHLHQSWRNHRNKHIKGFLPGANLIRSRLQRLESSLVETVDIGTAQAMVDNERYLLASMQDSVEQRVIELGMAHLDYLKSYWLREPLWKSWSAFARRAASNILGCPVDGVLRTTNHLESFNGVLKNKHLKRWQRGGRRLRLDMLIQLLVTKILPAIFEQRHLEEEEDSRWSMRIQALPGGDSLLHNSRRTRGQVCRERPAFAWFAPDETRDIAASQILADKQISVPDIQNDRYCFTCFSSIALQHEETPTVYNITLQFLGSGSCSCLDFQTRGGACKHMRAAMLRLQQLRTTMTLPDVQLPRDEAEAVSRHADLLFKTSTHISETTSPRLHQNIVQCAAAAIEDTLRKSDAYTFSYGHPKDATGPEPADDSNGIWSEDEGSDEESGTYSSDDPNMSLEIGGGGREGNVVTMEPGETSRAGLHEQVLAKVFYELKEITPRLCRISNAIKDSHIQPLESKPEVLQAEAYRNQLLEAANSLSLLISDISLDSDVTTMLTSISDQDPTPFYNGEISHTSLPLSQKRKRNTHQGSTLTQILPPSPEKASKRKQSYSVH